MKTLPALLLFLLLASGTHAQQPHSKTDVEAYVNRLMDIHVAFTTLAPPGWTMAVKEVSRERSANGLLVQYHVFLTGTPKGLIFRKLTLPVGEEKPKAAMEGITVGKDGLLICAGREETDCGTPSVPDDPIEFTMIAPLRGEPFRTAFSNPAGTISTVIVPDPVESKSHGCSLSAIRLTPAFEVAFVSGEGYPPNSDVHFQTVTGITVDSVIHSDAKGAIRLSVLSRPKRDNDKSGTTRVKITEPGCSPQVSYNWGKT
jgi:hypothetical protein